MALNPIPDRRILLVDDWSRLRGFRVWAGLTQQELADAVCASRATISSLERRRSIPSVGLALVLARTLDATVEELFPADDPR